MKTMLFLVLPIFYASSTSAVITYVSAKVTTTSTPQPAASPPILTPKASESESKCLSECGTDPTFFTDITQRVILTLKNKTKIFEFLLLFRHLEAL
jgi:hypothetical protein